MKKDYYIKIKGKKYP